MRISAAVLGSLLALSALAFAAEGLPTPAQDQASPEVRAEAERLLWAALDHEGLYTIAGGIKPMSSGIRLLRVRTSGGDSTELDRVRRACTLLRIGDDVEFFTYPFAALDRGHRLIEVAVVHRPSLQAAIARHRDFFLKLGVTELSDPREAVMAVEYASDPADRHRGYGYLFGYPDFAVDFFVQAQARQRRDGKFVERSFRQIPTFGAETGRFVYAVPKGMEPTEEERGLIARCLEILRRYRALRERFAGEGKPGVFELARETARLGHPRDPESPQERNQGAGSSGFGPSIGHNTPVGPPQCPYRSSESGSASVATGTSTRVCAASIGVTSKTRSRRSSVRSKRAPTQPRFDWRGSTWARRIASWPRST